MLEVKSLTKNFGGLVALDHVDLTVRKGDILGLIGPNGAGKTTFYNVISGTLLPSKGQVKFEERDITKKKPHHKARLGIVRTFQTINIYPDFTVLENVILSCHVKANIGLLETVFHTPGSRRKEQGIRRKSLSILELAGLGDLADVTANKLAHGHKRILGIAVALAAEPRILLLDEPLGGMNGAEVSEAVELVHKLWKNGLTIVLIEHNMRVAMSLCKRIAVLNFGRKIAEGSPDEIQKNDNVIQAYLGRD